MRLLEAAGARPAANLYRSVGNTATHATDPLGLLVLASRELFADFTLAWGRTTAHNHPIVSYRQ